MISDCVDSTLLISLERCIDFSVFDPSRLHARAAPKVALKDWSHNVHRLVELGKSGVLEDHELATKRMI